MKTLYVECKMGIAGDMLTAALIELFDDKAAILSELQTIVPENVVLNITEEERCAIRGTRLSVKINGEEENEEEKSHSLTQVCTAIENLNIPDSIKNKAKAIYDSIAKAEAEAHAKPANLIHFHEVGDADAISDIVCACFLIEKINPDRIVFSPINVGGGYVRCAHGLLPVPAPATVRLLKGVPVYGDDTDGELCTPTGAALAAAFAENFGTMPLMKQEKWGCGLGAKTFAKPNCLRVFIGEAYEGRSRAAELCCNIDDMTGEALSYACEILMEQGALDVFMTGIQMKKNRPGILLSCICDENEAEKFAAIILKHTTTIGVRVKTVERFRLERESLIKDTVFGKITYKNSYGYGVRKMKPEYCDVVRVAKERDISIAQVLSELPNE